MKKLILLALIAMMLIGMVAFSACKAKTEEIAPAIEIPTDTTVVVPVPEPVPAEIK
ncbi:MAG: hypothetical protein Q8J62_08620 [Candidatus Cloacimonadaceae bacterium]|nr:hypothetical protein [Candidatus Cloacimonadaceae bacterium]